VSNVPTQGNPLFALQRFFATSFTHDDRPWRMVLLRGPERDAVAFVWFHPFTDAKGAQRIVRFFGSGTDDDLAPLPEDARIRVRPEALEPLDQKALLTLAKSYNDHILAFSRRPILSLRGAAADKPIGVMRFERFILERSDTSALDRSIRVRAKLAESSVMIVAAARAVDRALRRRGFAPTHHMIPVPVSLDPKGESGRLFGNHLTMMMFALGRDDLLDERRAIASLAEQQRGIVRDKLDMAMAAALELVRVLPPRLYHGLATLPFGGELSSLIFSNPGVIAIDDFAGIPVRDAYAVPSVVPRPGIEVIVNRHRGALSVLLGYFDGLVPEPEARLMANELRAGLFASPPDPLSL
jgi:diacylglycerol O-acyltransferase